MHRKQLLVKLLKEWLELDLPSTCSPMDAFTSVNISKQSKRIVFLNKCRGRDTIIAQAFIDEAGGIGGVVLEMAEEIAMAKMLFSLEKAIEIN